MLVLSRKIGEKILIGDNITVVVHRVSGNRVTLGVDAPHDVKIIRGELQPYVDQFDEGAPAGEADAVEASALPNSALGFHDASPSTFTPRLAR